MQTEINFSPIDFLKDKGFTPVSDLPFCTESGAVYFAADNKNKSAIVAIIEDESLYLLTKEELRMMADSVKYKGVDEVILYTNYGLELHGKYESPKTVGMTEIYKMDSEGNDIQKLF
jgi:hypothetical protein